MKKILLQLTLDTKAKELQLGLADEIQGEDREYIMATLELLGNKMLMAMSDKIKLDNDSEKTE